MANPAKPGVKVILDKERTMRLTINGIMAFQEATGKDILNTNINWDDMSLKEMRTLLWACLIHEDKGLTEEQVGDLIDITNMEEVTEKLSEIWTQSTPKAAEGEQPGPLEGNRSNG